MKVAKTLFFVALATLVVLPAAHAGDDLWTKAQSEKYGTKFGGMLLRGFVNVLSSPVDLVVQTVDKTKEGPAFVGTLGGIGSGIGCTLLRAGSGVVDVTTSWVPGFNGVPVAKSYHNCLEADYARVAKTSYVEPATSSWSSTSAWDSSDSSWPAADSSAYKATADSSAKQYVDKSGAYKYVDKTGRSSSSSYVK